MSQTTSLRDEDIETRFRTGPAATTPRLQDDADGTDADDADAKDADGDDGDAQDVTDGDDADGQDA
jgi:hypothetical protein